MNSFCTYSTLPKKHSTKFIIIFKKSGSYIVMFIKVIWKTYLDNFLTLINYCLFFKSYLIYKICVTSMQAFVYIFWNSKKSKFTKPSLNGLCFWLTSKKRLNVKMKTFISFIKYYFIQDCQFRENFLDYSKIEWHLIKTLTLILLS